MGSIPGWQVGFLCGIVSWIAISSMLNVTRKLRSLTQSWVSRQVISGTPFILQIQKYNNGWLDAFFSGLSCVVSVPFYTAFLPLLFWSGHGKLARQMTLLMAFCDYSGNCIKTRKRMRWNMDCLLPTFLTQFAYLVTFCTMSYPTPRVEMPPSSLLDSPWFAFLLALLASEEFTLGCTVWLIS
ncbi:hypothetical protein CsSME_00039631 [Camellia sinensis var. sinensis]